MIETAPNRSRGAAAHNETPPHTKARAERPTDYPDRFPVSDAQVRWRVPYPEYAPPRYTSPSTLAHSPDPSSFAQLERPMFSHEAGGIRHDGSSGEPLNPKGRTGISGRGGLWLWGPNHAADLLLTRFNVKTNSLEALLIQRKSGQWAIPGGMVDPGESAMQAAVRELKEEAGVHASGRMWEVHRGYVDDPRNTDNAWMETVVFQEHLGTVEPHSISKPVAGSDAQAARWTPLSKDLIAGLYASHPGFVKSGLEILIEAPGTDSITRAAIGALLDL